MIISLVLAWIAVVVLGWLGWQLLRQNGRILLRLETLEQQLDELGFGDSETAGGLRMDSAAPEFDLPDLTGERWKLAQFRARPLLLVFFNPDCGFCRDLASKLAALSPSGNAASDGKPALVIVTTGEAEKNRRFFSEQKIACPGPLQQGTEVTEAYQASGTPTGYLINVEGKIASQLAIGAEALLALAGGNSQPQPSAPAAGEARRENPGSDRASRFGSRSLARSKIARNGLKAGTAAPVPPAAPQWRRTCAGRSARKSGAAGFFRSPLRSLRRARAPARATAPGASGDPGRDDQSRRGQGEPRQS